jgi:transposase
MTYTKRPSSKRDPRRRALREQGLLNPTADAVQDERFRDSDFFEPEDLVQVRYEMLRSVRTKEQTASAAAIHFGVSRATFYQVQAAFEREGVAGLVPHKRGPRGAHKLTSEVVDFVLARQENDSRLSSAALAELVGDRFNLSVHPRSIERALERQKKKRRRQT